MQGFARAALLRLRSEQPLAVLVRGAGGALVVKLGGAGLAFAVQIVLARLLGASQYGIYVYVLSWVGVLALLGLFGMDGALTRFVAAYRAEQDWARLRGLLRTALTGTLVASTLLAALGAALVWALRDRLGADQAQTFWVAFLLLPLLAAAGVRQSALRGLKRVALAELPEALLRPAVLGVLALALAMARPLDATGAMALNVLAMVLAFALGAVFLRRSLPLPATRARPVHEARTWLRVSLPLMFVAGMHLVLARTDVIMLGILQHPREAGIYAAAARVSEFVVFGLAAVNAIVAPLIAERHAKGEQAELQRILQVSARGAFAFTAALCLLLVLAGAQVLSWFGAEFAGGYAALVVLLAGQLVNAAAGSVGCVMAMSGHQSQAARILAVSAAVNVALNAVLIPPLGMTGAAIATAITLAAWNLAMLCYVQARLRLNPAVI